MNTSCPGCSYSLTPLLDGERVVCPECGKTWTREQVFRHDPSRAPGRWLIALLATPVVTVVCGGLATALAAARTRDPFSTGSLTGLVAGFVWAALWEGRILARAMTQSPSVIKRIFIVPAAAAFGLVVTFVSAVLIGFLFILFGQIATR